MVSVMMYVYTYLATNIMVFTNNKYPFCFLFFFLFSPICYYLKKEKKSPRKDCLPTCLSVPMGYLA